MKGKGPSSGRKGKKETGWGYWGPKLPPASSQSPLILPTHPPIHTLTYLVPQHALQPILAGSSQVDGQCWSAVLHHHHCLGQQVFTQLHHNLPNAALFLHVFAHNGPDLALGQQLAPRCSLKAFIGTKLLQDRLNDANCL